MYIMHEKKLSGRNKLISFLIIAIILLISFSLYFQVNSAELQLNDPTISGSISMPAGETAGKGGVSVTIKASPRELAGGPPSNSGESYQTQAVIPEGKSSAAYSIKASLPPEDFGFVINYAINNNSNLQIRDRGFYSSQFKGESVGFPFATICDIRKSNGSLTDINIIISKLRKVTGNILLPKGKTAPEGGLKVKLYLLNGKDINLEQIDNGGYYSIDCLIPAGKSSTEFKFSGIDPNERFLGSFEGSGGLNDKGYILMYQLSSTKEYKMRGFYASKGTAEIYNNAEPFDVTNQDKNGLNLVLLNADNPGVVKVTSVTLDKKAISIKVNGAAKLSATVLPANAADKTVLWTTSNKNIAAVDQNGKVTAKKPGITIITAKTKDGNKTASCTITVIK